MCVMCVCVCVCVCGGGGGIKVRSVVMIMVSACKPFNLCVYLVVHMNSLCMLSENSLTACSLI